MNWKPLAIAFILSAGPLALFGQIPASFGLKGGLSVANQSYKITPIDYELGTKALTGPALALFVEAFKGNHFSFQFDLGYVVKGSKTTTQSVTVNHLDNDRIVVNEGESASSRFSYLSLAPMVRYRWDLGKLTPYLLLGPRVDFLLSYKTDSDYSLEEQNEIIPGLTCGLGAEFNLNTMGLFLELQYQTDAMPVSGKDPLLINNNVLLFTLGIRRIVSE